MVRGDLKVLELEFSKMGKLREQQIWMWTKNLVCVLDTTSERLVRSSTE